MPEQFRNLVDLCERSCRRHASRPLFGTKGPRGWSWTTYGEFLSLVESCRGGLARLGVGPGDRVAIVSNNRVEWAAAAYATYGLAATVVPLYEAQQPREWAFILGDCRARVVFGSRPDVLAKLLDVGKEIPAIEHVIGFELPAEDPRSWGALLAAGKEAPVPVLEVDEATVAGFLYTSGTTGNPKGVVLTHGNLTSNVNAVHQVFEFDPDDRSLSFLPWAHSFGQTCELHNLLSMGCSMGLNDDVRNLVPNLAEVRPTVLFAVPLVFNRIHAGVLSQMSGRPRAIRELFELGLRAAVREARGEPCRLGDRLARALADRLIFSRIRERFGGRLRYAVSGSAALDREVGEFLDAIGITVYEGYGLSETSPIVSANVPGHRKLGSAGVPLPGVRVVIAPVPDAEPPEGEIVVYGPNVMRGYHERPDENARALTPDGGLRTGDLGRLDDDGFLHVTGRIKELYKLQNGKYVMPTVLEEHLKLSPYVAHAMVYGDNRPYNVALVVPNRDAVLAWTREQGLANVDRERVRRLIREEIESFSREFRGFERIGAFAVLDEEFTIDNGMLTPTLKLKRRNVTSRYAGEIEALYEAAVSAA